MKNKLKITETIILLILIIHFSGCASVTRGTTEALEVNSVPPEVALYLTRTNANLTKTEIKKNFTKEEAEKILNEQQDNFYGPIQGKTPAVFTLKREGEYKIRFEKEGYKSMEVKVIHQTAGGGAAGMAGNVILGGAIGAIIDANTGATQELVPNPVNVTLEKEEQEQLSINNNQDSNERIFTSSLETNDTK